MPRRRAGSVLTPLADAVFLLVIFFMLASSYQQTSSLNLSLATPASAPVEASPIILHLVREGAFLLNEQELARTELPSALRTLAQNPDSQDAQGLRPVLVLVAEEVPIDDLTFALAVLSAAGFSRIATAEQEA